MYQVPYTYIAVSFCLLVGFYKIGELDEEIGRVIGVGIGLAVLALNYQFKGGYLGLTLWAVGGFIFLTLYKIIRGITDTRNPDRESDIEQ